MLRIPGWLAAAVVVVATLALPTLAHAATYTVDTTADTTVGAACADPSHCSLRGAITAANVAGGPNTISVTPGVYHLANGELTVTSPMTITRAGSGGTVTIDADALSRVVNISAATTIADVTITDGKAVDSPLDPSVARGGGIYATASVSLQDVALIANHVVGSGIAAQGGAAWTTAALTTDGVVFSGNTADGSGAASAQGGAVFAATVTTAGTTSFTGNQATSTGGSAQGGALYYDGAGMLSVSADFSGNVSHGALDSYGGAAYVFAISPITVTASQVSGNIVESDFGNALGGGIAFSGPSTIGVGTSTFDANVAIAHGTSGFTSAWGGAFVSDGDVTVTNSTIYRNVVIGGGAAAAPGRGAFGGGILVRSRTLSLVGATITGNVARVPGVPTGGAGSGIGLIGETATVLGSIVSGNTGGSGSDCDAGSLAFPAVSMLSSNGGNVVGDATMCGMTAAATDAVTTTPGLGALADNGGPTTTALPDAGSAALDRYTTGCPATDQRSVARPQGSACDSGAVEVALTPPPPAPASGGGGGTVPQCDDLVGSTPFGTPIGLKLTCSATVWSWAVTRAPAHGTLSPITANGEIGYTPDTGFSGTDSFAYVAAGGSGQSAPATVTIQVGAGPAATTTTQTPSSAPTCTSRRVTVRLNRRGEHLVSAHVTVDGKRVTAQHDRTRWTATFEAKGTTTVQIRARRADGRLVHRTRTLALC
jgi:CSLREA domain-containing protein